MAYEIEPNNTFATATKAAFGVPLSGQISSSADKDLFLYVADGAGLFSIDFSDPNGSFYATVVSLLDSSGNVLGSISGATATKLETYVGSAGNYYVQLSKAVANGSQYSLTVNIQQSDNTPPTIAVSTSKASLAAGET